MSNAREELFKNICETLRQMNNDSLEHNPVYFSGAVWNPTNKVQQKLQNPDSVRDIASSVLNGHFAEWTTDSKIYEEYQANLTKFLDQNKINLSLEISDTDSYKTSCAILYELCLMFGNSLAQNSIEKGEYAKILLTTPIHETENSFVYKGVNLTWGHIVSMWSCLTILGNSFDLFSKKVITIMDLGCGSGRMGYLLCKAFPDKVAYIACDLPTSSAITQCHLMDVLPDLKCYTYNDNKNVEKFTKEYFEKKPGIHVVCAHDITRFSSKSVDVVANIFSLGEMPPGVIIMYHRAIQSISSVFYSLNNRNFDYSAGTGFFRDYHTPKETRHRPISCTLSGDMRTGSPCLRQWPPWPAPSINLTPGDMSPPWSNLYFEEVHYLPSRFEFHHNRKVIDQLIKDGYPYFDEAGTQLQIPIDLSRMTKKID